MVLAVQLGLEKKPTILSVQSETLTAPASIKRIEEIIR